MVHRDLAARKNARAAAWMADAEPILRGPVEDFLADVKSCDLATFYIFLAIQEAIDLAAHWGGRRRVDATGRSGGGL